MRKRLLLQFLLLGLLSAQGVMIERTPLLQSVSSPVQGEIPGEVQPQNDLQPDKKVRK